MPTTGIVTIDILKDAGLFHDEHVLPRGEKVMHFLGRQRIETGELPFDGRRRAHDFLFDSRNTKALPGKQCLAISYEFLSVKLSWLAFRAVKTDGFQGRINFFQGLFTKIGNGQ